MKKIILSLMLLVMMVGVVSAYGIESSGKGDYDFQYVIQDGEQTIHITADLIPGPPHNPPYNEATLIVTFDSQTTLEDLDSISWNAEVIEGYLPHVDVFLDNGETLTFEYAKVQTPCDNAYPEGNLNTFGDKGIIDDSAYAWESIPGYCGLPAFDEQHKTLADWKTIYGDVEITKIEFEVDGWIEASESYFNNLVINGEEVEELFVSFNFPAEGEYVSDEIVVDWNNPGSISGLFLQYKEGSCSGIGWTNLNENFNGDETSYNWDTTLLDEGEYCSRLEVSGYVYATSGVFTIDRTAPTIEFIGAPYFSQVDVEINIQAEVEDENEFDEWELDFGDETSTIKGSLESIDETHTYDEEGTYLVTLTAKDKAGNEASATTIVVVNGEEPDWIIPLFTGMNLFSIPLVSESTDIEDVLPEEVSGKAIKIWSYQKGKWKFNVPDGSGWDYSTGTTKVLDIVPGYGYILFMDEDTVAYGNGRELGEKQLPTDKITLTAGWNLIGLYGTEEKTVDTALFGLKSVFSGLTYWNQILNSQLITLEGTDYMEPTKAYWIDMNSNDFEDPEDKTFLY